jgi:ABC-type Zn uptake system ZnuABC Zn-binding protein ZnuA
MQGALSCILGLAAVLLLASCGRAAPPALQSPAPRGTGAVPVSAEGSWGQANTGRDARLPEMRSANLAGGQKLQVVATTGIVGDVVKNGAGDLVDLTELIGPGQDPHTYQPTPRDIAAIERAHVVFINGFGLEEGLVSTIDAAAGKGSQVVSVSAGIQPLPSSPEPKSSPAQAQGHLAGDPHVWFDPANVKVWASNIEKSLSALDPGNTATYQANAAAYVRQLDELDAYIRAQVALIPTERRKLVTDHEAFGYFADRYGFQVVGAVIPSVSTSAEPSAGDLAALVEKIRAEGVPAVFVGTTTNPKVSDLVAQETGAQILRLYTGETGAPGSGAETYIGIMRANVDTIVKGLTNVGDSGASQVK